jgi:hypothetical protein
MVVQMDHTNEGMWPNTEQWAGVTLIPSLQEQWWAPGEAMHFRVAMTVLAGPDVWCQPTCHKIKGVPVSSSAWSGLGLRAT